ncbi:MAG TPA: glycosyltransferase, partial [Clostridia bacterium]|nr:glycosyltransferase [Clostridia bacterium]
MEAKISRASTMPFSVAMSVYKNDNAEFFDRALESIITAQTVIPDEVSLIVDGPVTDEIDTVIKKYLSLYAGLNVTRLSKNAGLGNALKLAVENCRNELIARMDSDDVSVSNRFEQQLDLFASYPDVDVIGGNISEFVDNEVNIVAHRNVPIGDAEIKEYLKKRCPLNHMSVMYKKSAVLAS